MNDPNATTDPNVMSPAEDLGGDASLGITEAEVDSIYDPEPALEAVEAGEPVPEPGIAPELSSDPSQTAPGDPIIEVPGIGPMKASEIQDRVARAEEAQAMRSKLTEFEQNAQSLKAENESARQAMHLLRLMENPAFAQSVEQSIREHGGSEELARAISSLRAPAQNGRQIPDNDPVAERLNAVEKYVETLQVQEAKQNIENILNGFGAKYPDVVTDEFRSQVKRLAWDRFQGNGGLTEDTFRGFVADRILEVGIPAREARARAEVVEAMKNQPPGTRIVTGDNSRHAAKSAPKDPRKMSWAELEQEGADIAFSADRINFND